MTRVIFGRLPLLFFSLPFSELGFRYDCERNQWNHCHLFNFTENSGARDDQSDSSEDDYMWGPLPPQLEQNNIRGHQPDSDKDDDCVQGSLPPRLEQSNATSLHHELPTSHCDADGEMADNLLPEQNGDRTPHPETNSGPTQGLLPMHGTTVDHPAEASSFNSNAHLSQLHHAQNDAPPRLVSVWNDVCGFFYSRYGTIFISNKQDASKHGMWSARLGMKGTPPTSIVELYDSLMKGSWPPGVCDLSPELGDSNPFPAQSPDTALCVDRISNAEGYLITVARRQDVRWKLLIRDPLTLLQIKREGWDCDPHALVVNLIEKGIPFQVLNPGKLEGTQFYDHPGPVVHQIGKEPQYVDYLAYRQELGAFFAHYPHAYAAALSAGGILWRIAMDVLPPPHESDITRRFHPNGCTSSVINGKKYWSPKLTVLEEDVIVGVYKWAVCKSTHNNSSDTRCS